MIFLPSPKSRTFYITHFQLLKKLLGIIYRLPLTLGGQNIIPKKSYLPILLNNLTFREPVLACQQELRGHVQGTLRADIIALGAEDTLGDINTDTLC
jgi:hypothetical protein